MIKNNGKPFGYIEAMYSIEIEQFERKHGKVKFTEKGLKEVLKSFPKFDNDVYAVKRWIKLE